MDKLSFTEELIAFLTSARSTTIYRRNLYRMLREKRSNFSDQRVRLCLHRLKKRGVIKLDDENVYVSKRQLVQLTKKSSQIDMGSAPGKTEHILLFYDIPETMRFARRLIREQLKFWNYKMVQQSVWFGNGPLPSEFKNQLKKWGVADQVQIMSLKKK